MSLLPAPMRERYSPLYFLASLGAGGPTVTFFMFLMFWVPHPGQPVPIFEDIAKAFATGGVPMQVAIAVAMAGIAVMALKHPASDLEFSGAGRVSTDRRLGGDDTLER